MFAKDFCQQLSIRHFHREGLQMESHENGGRAKYEVITEIPLARSSSMLLLRCAWQAHGESLDWPSCGSESQS